MLQKIFNKVIIDGQAYLFAKIMEFQAHAKGQEVTEEMFEKWEDDWKKETATLVETLVETKGSVSE